MLWLLPGTGRHAMPGTPGAHRVTIAHRPSRGMGCLPPPSTWVDVGNISRITTTHFLYEYKSRPNQQFSESPWGPDHDPGLTLGPRGPLYGLNCSFTALLYSRLLFVWCRPKVLEVAPCNALPHSLKQSTQSI